MCHGLRSTYLDKFILDLLQKCLTITQNMFLVLKSHNLWRIRCTLFFQRQNYLIAKFLTIEKVSCRYRVRQSLWSTYLLVKSCSFWTQANFATASDAPKKAAHFKSGQSWPLKNQFDLNDHNLCKHGRHSFSLSKLLATLQIIIVY